MQTGVVILLLLIVFLLWRLAFGPRFLSSASNEWLVIEKHTVNSEYGKTIPTIEIWFEPIIGWRYAPCKNRYGKLTPMTTTDYRAYKRLATKNKYKLLIYWLRESATFITLDDWSDGHGDLWTTLSSYSKAGKNVEIRGGVPTCFQPKITEILTKADQRAEVVD